MANNNFYRYIIVIPTIFLLFVIVFCFFPTDIKAAQYPNANPEVISGFTENDYLRFYYWSFIGGTKEFYIKKTNQHNCGPANFDEHYTLSNATNTIDTNILISPGDSICIYGLDNTGSPPPPWPWYGWADPHGGLCGENGFMEWDVSSYIAQAQAQGRTLVKQMCWGDWDESRAGVDRDYNDYFLIFSYRYRDGTIQGRKGFVTVESPFIVQEPPATTETISIPSLGYSSTGNPYSKSGIALNGETHAVTASTLSGYEAASTLCYDDAGCHGLAYTVGNTRNVSETSIINNFDPFNDPYPYADLYWHYIPLPTCQVAGPVTIQQGSSADYTATATVPKPTNVTTNVTVDANVLISRTSTVPSGNPPRTIGDSIGAIFKDCADVSTCTQTATIATAGMNIGDRFNVYCRGWNKGNDIGNTLHECNPFLPWDPLYDDHPRDADCALSGDYITVEVIAPTYSCNVNLTPANPVPYSIPKGQSQQFTAWVFPSPVGEPIVKVRFTSSNIDIIDPSPLPNPYDDLTSPYRVEYKAVGNIGQIASYQADVYMGVGQGVLTCSAQGSVTIGNAEPWWRVIDADVFSQGTITSLLPIGDFDVYGPGDFPGVPVYDGDYDFGWGEISTEDWIADADYSGARYDYNYFYDKKTNEVDLYEITTASLTGAQLISAINAATADSKGYKWLIAKHVNGLTITSAADIFFRKAILFVEDTDSPFRASGNLTFNDGTGFLMVISNSGIEVGKDVTTIEGIYVADGEFSTGTDGEDSSLGVRGMVVSWDLPMDFERNLSNDLTAAEVFAFAPDLLFLLPPEFGRKSVIWKEVAP